MSSHGPLPFQTVLPTGQCFSAGGPQTPNSPRLVTERPRSEYILLRKNRNIIPLDLHNLEFSMNTDIIIILCNNYLKGLNNKQRHSVSVRSYLRFVNVPP